MTNEEIKEMIDVKGFETAVFEYLDADDIEDLEVAEHVSTMQASMRFLEDRLEIE